MSSSFIDELALPGTARPLAELLGTLKPTIESRQSQGAERLQRLRPHADDTSSEARAATTVGLNTVGLLCDRLTVLAMKEWVLRSRKSAPAEAAALRETQVSELVDALAAARPGYSSFTQKLSPLHVDAPGDTWEQAYLGLLSVNILLWEAQEILYAGQIEHLECDELRRYIAWFSEGNIRRNNYIAKCEKLFWENLRVESRFGTRR
jgi:hypothetical protein